MASEDVQDNDEILLHLYMHDYFIKNNMHETAASLRQEAGVPNNSVQIDHPQGILKEWWSSCSDIILKEFSEAETSAQMSKQMMQTEEHQNTDDMLQQQQMSNHMMQTEENQNTDDMLQQQQDSVGNTSTPVRNLSPGHSGESDNKGYSVKTSTKKLCIYTLICVYAAFFGEGNCLNCSTEEVLCCDFSSDGKLLAIAGREEKVLFWNTEDHNKFVTGESHSLPISDVRFKPNSTMVLPMTRLSKYGILLKLGNLL